MDPRFARTMTALTAKEVTTIPMRLVEAKYDLMKVSSRVENIFNSIPSSITNGKIKGKNTQFNQPIITKLTKVQEKNARRKAMKNGGLFATKTTRKNEILDEKTSYFQSLNKKLNEKRNVSIIGPNGPAEKRAKFT